MRTYTAKTKHKRDCVLCLTAIIPGDRVTSWTWVSDDPPPMGGICATHSTCCAIMEREELGDESIVGFEDADEQRWDQGDAKEGSIPDDAYHLSIEAAKALAAERDARRTPIERAAAQLLYELGHGYMTKGSDADLAAAVLESLVPAKDYGNGPGGALKT